MCGIAGAYSLGGELPADVLDAVSRMREPLHHRGPDASGYWVSPDRKTALTATRLAIRDLRSEADQPFRSARGATVYNGELYDWPAEALSRGGARTSGDTEVIHELTCTDPLLLTRVSGMYAVATWRAATGSLVLARDPAGEKPLYITRNRRWIAFASELRALVMAGLLEPDLNRDAIAMLLRLGHVPEPLTIYKGAQPLAAGTILEFHRDDRQTEHSWWPEPAVDKTLLRPAAVREAVVDAVRNASVADVPTGVFLSGGIDSSVIAAAARAGGSTLKALTLTTRGSADESEVAASTARHLQMPHEVVTVTPEEARGSLVDFFKSMDQPTVDGFNSYLISKAARSSGLTVALSGLGGDELFRGYPSFTRMGLAHIIRSIPGRRQILGRWRGALEGRQERSSDLLLAGNSVESYVAIRGVLSAGRAERLLGEQIDWPSQMRRFGLEVGETGDRQTSQYEARLYMRSQLLRDLDVFAMASSLEVRAPLLSPSLISIAGALPNDKRLRGKQLLKDAFRNDLPPELFGRPKEGFTLPWAEWLRTSLRSSTLEAFDGVSAHQAIFDPIEAVRALRDFEQGRLHWSGLWVLVAFCRWALVQPSRSALITRGVN